MSGVDRIPPQDIAAEAAVLGAVLIEREMFLVASGHLRTEDFYAPFHATIWRSMSALYESGQPVDKITLADRLRNQGDLEHCGGLPYLTTIMDTVPTAASVEYYARIVADKAASRAVIRIAIDLQGKAYEEYFASAAELQDYAVRELTRALAVGAVDTTHISAILETVVGRIGDERQQPFFSQWERIDRLTGGFQPGELVVWAAAPAMGKSVMLSNYAEYTASAYAPMAFQFGSLEMTQEDTVLRMLSERSGVSVRKIREGDALTGEDWAGIQYAHAALAKYPLEFQTRHPRRSMADIKRAARQTHQKNGRLSGIAIDHVGFVADLARASERSGGKHAALDNLLGEMLELGDELRCPIHVVYHLNRGAKADRPTIFDLRDGGNTEGNATTILFPWRPNPGNDPSKVDENGVPIPTTRAECIVAKTRHGTPGTVPMHFDGAANLWSETDGDPRPWFERAADWRPEARRPA